MDWIRGADTALFLLVNGTWRTPWLDSLFLFLSDPPMRATLLAVAWIGLIVFGGRRGLWGGFALLLAVGAADQIAAEIMKPWVDRVRPCFVVPEAHLLLPYQARSPSFPSNHAANAFAAAVLISWVYSGPGRLAYLLAALIALSRVYLGVHYPLDIAAGALLGLILGMMGRNAASWALDRTGADIPRAPARPSS